MFLDDDNNVFGDSLADLPIQGVWSKPKLRKKKDDVYVWFLFIY